MKLQPLLFDTSVPMFGAPRLTMPYWGRWSHPVGDAPSQSYHRLQEYAPPQFPQEIPADFWDPVVRNSDQQSRMNNGQGSRPMSEQSVPSLRLGTERSVPITIEHESSSRSRKTGMFDDRVCDYNQPNDHDRDYRNRGDYALSSNEMEETDRNENANGARYKTNERTRSTRSSDRDGRPGGSRSDLYDRNSGQRSRSDAYRTSENLVSADRSRENLVEKSDTSKKCDFQELDAQIAASYGYEMIKDDSDVELRVMLPESTQKSSSNTPILAKLRTLKSPNMYVILDEEEEEEVRSTGSTCKNLSPSTKPCNNMPEFLNSRGEFYDLCERNEHREYQDLVVNMPPSKVKSPTESPVKRQMETLSTTPPDNRNISAPPSYPAYNIIRKVISSFGGIVDYIRGDGNCFFRALSKVIYGVESCHGEVRQAMVDIMEKFPKDFEQFIDNPSIEDHFKEMREDGVWATQAEIYGAASFLQRDIYILSPDHTGDQYRWLLFSPRLKCSKSDTYHKCHVTLCHTNGNHYDRIAPATGDCNCGVAPPVLNGTNVEVDLTASCSVEVV